MLLLGWSGRLHWRTRNCRCSRGVRKARGRRWIISVLCAAVIGLVLGDTRESLRPRILLKSSLSCALKLKACLAISLRALSLERPGLGRTRIHLLITGLSSRNCRLSWARLKLVLLNRILPWQLSGILTLMVLKRRLTRLKIGLGRTRVRLSGNLALSRNLRVLSLLLLLLLLMLLLLLLMLLLLMLLLLLQLLSRHLKMLVWQLALLEMMSSIRTRRQMGRILVLRGLR